MTAWPVVDLSRKVVGQYPRVSHGHRRALRFVLYFWEGLRSNWVETCPWALMINSQSGRRVYLSTWGVTTEDLVSCSLPLVSENGREVWGVLKWLWLPGLHSATHRNGTWKKVPLERKVNAIVFFCTPELVAELYTHHLNSWESGNPFWGVSASASWEPLL